MLEKGVRSPYSQSPFQIIMYDNNGMISTGTAFFYSLNNDTFLITNWHNLSGRNFITKEPLGARLPTYIKAKFATYIDNNGSFTKVAQKIEIYYEYEPIWYEHPKLGSDYDVVALPLELPKSGPNGMHIPANLISKTKIPVHPGNSAFVIGYPKSISVGFGLPLWKSGFIASEPYYDITIGGEISEIGGLSNGRILPAFFIDTQTREGMSGSPVFSSYVGSWDTTDPYRPINPEEEGFWFRNDVTLGDNRMEFIGCYSGRIGKTEEGAALGLCWRENVIKEICESKKIAKHPHID